MQTGSVDEHQLGIRTVHDAAYGMPGGLRLRRGDHDLLADQRVGQSGLAGIRPTDKTRETRPKRWRFRHGLSIL
jgi:hypothetical protein